MKGRLKNMNSNFKIGIPSILMLLFSICLISFSVLSFSTSYADYKLSKKIVTRTNAYYAACNEAYETIDKLISSNSPVEDTYYFYISDFECLCVKLNPDNPSDILSWNVYNTNEDNYDEHLNVLP